MDDKTLTGREAKMDWKQLKELIELVSDKGFAEFEMERQGFRLRISASGVHHSGAANASAHQSASTAAPTAVNLQPAESDTPAVPVHSPAERRPAGQSEKSGENTLVLIKSPIVGTFYRAPSPDSPPFINVGDRVEPESVVCIIEAMKLMNEIQAETRGEVAEIYVENGQAVEFDQPLFGIRK